MSDSSESPQRGIPIYRDPIDRGLPDPTDDKNTDWYPATPATTKLWRCYEAMQKLLTALDGTTANSTPSQQRRFLIRFSVPVCDFFTCVLDLINAIEGDAQTRSRLCDAELQDVRTLRTRLDEAVLTQIGPLKAIRDKLGAHTDKSLDPSEATRLIDAVNLHMVGAWLHAGLLALDKLTKIDCFAWSSAGYSDDHFRLMTCEPFVLSVTHDDLDLIGFEMTESPKRHIHERIADVVECSTWMFVEGQPRLIVTRSEVTGS